MNPPTSSSAGAKPADPDLAEQAVPGHGVPSQDPDPAAQVALRPEEAAREPKSALMGGGTVAGVATGAAIGAAVAAPVGVMVGGTIGAVAGALGVSATGGLASPESTTRADGLPKDAKHTPRGSLPR
ncbi:MAG: hypothetical protein H7345_02185 [Rubritepida sp.]|nr:hypothetical protein [Rubritepida sp.]